MPPEVLGAEDQGGWDDVVLQHLLVVVEVVEEEVQGGYPLDQAGLDAAPFGGGDDAGDEVEGEDAFGALGVVVDREGDAAAEEGGIDCRPAAVELGGGEGGEAFREALVVLPHAAVLRPGEHLVEEAAELVVGGQQGHGRGGLPSPKQVPCQPRGKRSGAPPDGPVGPFEPRPRARGARQGTSYSSTSTRPVALPAFPGAADACRV
jgi:hypothetical protein